MSKGTMVILYVSNPESGPAFQFHTPAEKREEGAWSGEAQGSDMIKPKKATC